MKMRHLAIVPALFLVVACGGSSTPEPETAAGASEQKPAEASKPADKPAEGGEAAPAGGGEEKK